MRRILAFAAAAEALTGLSLVAVPYLVAQLLLGEALSGAAPAVARVAGIALVGLAVACWPGSPAAGMLAYGAGVALYLAYLGLTGEATGPLLWPVVGVHVVVTTAIALLLWKQSRRSGINPA